MGVVTDRTGTIAELAVELALLRRYTNVLRPTLKSRYDLVFEDDGHFFRVQVKHGRYKKGCIEFSTKSYCAFTKVHAPYLLSEIDYYGIYSSDLEKVYLIPRLNFDNKSKGSLRVDKDMRPYSLSKRAEDYEI